MSKYINAEKLYKYLEQVNECYPRYADNIVDNAVSNVIDGIKTFITSRQQEQPEVDLEKDIDAFFDKWEKNSNGCIFDENGARVTINNIKGVVKHFLNARKEE